MSGTAQESTRHPRAEHEDGCIADPCIFSDRTMTEINVQHVRIGTHPAESVV